MTNYLSMGAEKLQQLMENYGGVNVTYRRTGVFSFTVAAVPGRNPTDVYDQRGVLLRGQIQDFTIAISKLTAGMTSGSARPLRGDEIVMQVGEYSTVFVVNGEDFSTGHYQPSDSYGIAWRIHTKSDRIDASGC